MTDIKAKLATKKKNPIDKSLKVKKIKVSDRLSAAVIDEIGEDDDGYPSEAECLWRSALDIKKTCQFEEDEAHGNHDDAHHFQPIDQLMRAGIYHKTSGYEKPGNTTEEDYHDYVVVGCRFPNGVVVSLGNNKMLLRGINDMPNNEELYHYDDVGFTKIVTSVWKYFLTTHKNWPPLVNGSVFVVSNKEKN